MSVALLPILPAQQPNDFFEAPPPSDFPDQEGILMDELGMPIDDNAAALEVAESMGQFEENPVSFSFAIREGYDDNLFTTETNRDGSMYTNFAAGMTYTAETSRMQLNLVANGGTTYYYTRPGNKFDFTGTLGLNAVYQLTPRLTLALSTNTSYLAQPDLAVAGTSARNNGDYIYSTNTISGTYQWSEKFSTQTKYNITPFIYVEQSLNDSQGRIEQTIDQSFNWLVLPTTTAVVEYRANPVTYYVANTDNFGQYFLLGVDQVFNPRFKVNARGGAELRFLNTTNYGSSTYFNGFGEVTGVYEYQKLSNIALTARYGTEPSGLNAITIRQTFRLGLNITQGITPKLSFQGGVNYLNNYYDRQDGSATDFFENILEFSIAANFKINRNLILQGGYTYTIDSAPSSEQLSYQRNVAFLGLNFNF